MCRCFHPLQLCVTVAAAWFHVLGDVYPTHPEVSDKKSRPHGGEGYVRLVMHSHSVGPHALARSLERLGRVPQSVPQTLAAAAPRTHCSGSNSPSVSASHPPDPCGQHEVLNPVAMLRR